MQTEGNTSERLSSDATALLARIQRLEKSSVDMPPGPEREALLRKIGTLEDRAGIDLVEPKPPEAKRENGTVVPPNPPKKQRSGASKKVIIAGLTLFLLSGLFPPWNSVVDNKAVHLEKNIGYHLLFDPPENPRIRRVVASAEIDFPRLGLQWFLVVCAAGAVLYLNRPKQLSQKYPSTAKERGA